MFNHPISEALIVAAALYISDMFLMPMFATSDIGYILKFVAQAYIVLFVDDMTKRT